MKDGPRGFGRDADATVHSAISFLMKTPVHSVSRRSTDCMRARRPTGGIPPLSYAQDLDDPPCSPCEVLDLVTLQIAVEVVALATEQPFFRIR